MGLCNSKASTGDTGIFDKVKNAAFTLLVKQGTGDSNNQ